MGCGRSTMGNDSPTGNSHKDEESAALSEFPSKSSHQNNLHGQVIPFSPGGPLLAQAKISESQKDFFKVLDNKIQSGPDFDSEGEELIEKSHLQMCLQQLNNGTHDKDEVISLTTATKSNSVVTSEQEDSWSYTEESTTGEAMKEQYMFMGNLYTLTRLNADGSQPKHVVAISPAPPNVVDESADTIEPILIPSKDSPAKINSTGAITREVRVRHKLQRADTPFHSTISNPERIQPRPASLVLKTVFPTREDN